MSDKNMSEMVHPSLEQASFRNPFSRAKEAITTRAKDVLYGKPSVVASEPNMPHDLQYALEYKNGQLGRQEIASLINNNFTDLATYSLLKGMNSHQEEQQKFLSSFVDIVVEDPTDKATLKNLQIQTLTNSTGEMQIKGAKVAQIIRQGVNLWGSKFKEVGNELKEDAETMPVYIAYAGTLGLRQGVESLRETDRKMMVLIPDWVDEEDNLNCGYEIDLSKSEGQRVQMVRKDFERPNDFVFVDDTRRNGVHTQVMWDFWTQNSGDPLSEDHVKVVNFAPKTARV